MDKQPENLPIKQALTQLELEVMNNTPRKMAGTTKEPVHVRYGGKSHYGEHPKYGPHFGTKVKGYNIHLAPNKLLINTPDGRTIHRHPSKEIQYLYDALVRRRRESQMGKVSALTDEDVAHYVKEYYADAPDEAHGMEHINAVRDRMKELVARTQYKKQTLADAAALLHDIGNKYDRKTHEIIGADLAAKDPILQNRFNKRDLKLLINAIRQHRATTGKPRSHLGKMLGDADRLSSWTTPGSGLKRAFNYGKKHRSDMSEEDNLLESARHQQNKYGPEGYGVNSLNFQESRDHIAKMMKPVITAYKNKDIKKLRELAGLDKAAEEKPKHILITGAPGSGKSTLAKELEKKLNLPILEGDALPLRKGVTFPGTNDLRKALKKLKEPHIVEGVQILGLKEPELRGHDLRLLEVKREELIKRLMKRGWRNARGDYKNDRKGAEVLTDRYLKNVKKFKTPPLDKKAEAYEPPYNIKELKEKGYTKLLNDPVHKWREESGLELLHKEPTKKELLRIIKNWHLMNKEQKKLSDAKSIELFSKGNEDRIEELLKEAEVKLDIDIGDILLGGRFKNKREVVRKIGTDELGQPTINGKKLLSFRIEKKLPDSKKSSKTRKANKKG